MEKEQKMQMDAQFGQLYKKAELCAQLGSLEYLNGQKSIWANGYRWVITITPKGEEQVTWAAGEGYQDGGKVSYDTLDKTLDRLIETYCNDVKEKNVYLTGYFAPEMLF